METKINPIPQGYHSVTPYLVVEGAERALDFYKKAFGAKEIFRMDAPGGKIAHCEFEIGDSKIMMADKYGDMKWEDPHKATSFSLMVYVEKVDELFKRAIEAGGKEVSPVENKFYGDRMGTIEDPFGHKWHLASQVELVSPDEMRKRAEQIFSKLQ